jgi:hypothetical protein
MNFNEQNWVEHKATKTRSFRLMFPNDYGISVLAEQTEGLYEVAILKRQSDGIKLCYESGLTEDVFRYLSEEEVILLSKKVESLQKKSLRYTVKNSKWVEL